MLKILLNWPYVNVNKNQSTKSTVIQTEQLIKAIWLCDSVEIQCSTGH